MTASGGDDSMLVGVDRDRHRVLVIDPDRLSKPMMRDGGSWRVASFSVETLLKDFERVFDTEAEALFQEAKAALGLERKRLMDEEGAFYSTRKRMAEWQNDLIMIASNIAYLRTEADFFDTVDAPASILDLPDVGIIKNRVRTIADLIEIAYKKVRNLEIELLYAARSAVIERKPTSLAKLIDPLIQMKGAFKDALLYMHSEIKIFENLEDYSIVFMLLTNCGAEIHNAHREFWDKVELFRKDIDEDNV